MAALKLGDAAGAEADCTAALHLDGSYVKAYQRRAAARQLLNRLPEVSPKAALCPEPVSTISHVLTLPFCMGSLVKRFSLTCYVQYLYTWHRKHDRWDLGCRPLLPMTLLDRT